MGSFAPNFAKSIVRSAVLNSLGVVDDDCEGVAECGLRRPDVVVSA